MPSRPTGSKLTRTAAGVYVARVTLLRKRYSLQLTRCHTEPHAQERAAQLALLAARMTIAATEREAALDGLGRVATAPAGQSLKVACAFCDKLIGGWRPKSTAPTFREVAERWCDEQLVAEFPGTVKPRALTSIRAARANLKRYAYETLGDIPVDEITLQQCDSVKHALPAALRDDSRRQALMPIKTTLGLCVEPLRLIERSPLPPKWLPKKGQTRTLQWLYPSEDAQLMSCVDVPLWARVLFGFLIREGTRESETLRMTDAHFDLDPARGTARLDAGMTKTKRARMWQLDPGTARALRAWRKLRPGTGNRMFTDAHGKPWTSTRELPELLRKYLRLAGVERAELFTTTVDARNIVGHDLRASFATVKLALGKSEAWISARTGHMSSTQLRSYQRAAQTFAELHVGDFEALDSAIPELRASDSERQRCVSETRKSLKADAVAHFIVKAERVSQLPETTESQAISLGPIVSQSAAAAHADASLTRIAELEQQLAALRATLASTTVAASSASTDAE